MAIKPSENTKLVGEFVYAHQLDVFFEKYTSDYAVLSLDCFDTLLWRDVGQPKDVFFDLERTVIGRRLGLTAKVRAQAEKAVREERVVKGLTTEIHLRDIYCKAFPDADSLVIDDLVATELAVELERCYIYVPTLKLLKEAKRRGLSTIIVSDIYMSSEQLRTLIMGALQKIGEPCPIDYFFASCDKGISKVEGLIGIVAKEIKVKPHRIIHLGDNEAADVIGAVKCGANGILLRQYERSMQEIMRNVRYSTTLLDADIRSRKPYPDSWSGVWAQSFIPSNAINILGQYSLGPILLNYTFWLANEIQLIKATGKKPRVVFMLRDGYMPARVFEAAQNFICGLKDLHWSEIETSRFIAYACSFNSKEKVIDYLQFLYETSQQNIPMALKQLLFTKEEIERLSQQFSGNRNFKRFIDSITKAPYINQIIERSADYRARFVRRFRDVVDPQPGETIILADLGYAGTIQTLIQQILEEEFSVKVCGRYLILQDTLNKKDKRGLINEQTHDLRAVNLILKHIATLEQLCSNNLPSTIDFSEAGKPIYSDQIISETQRARRENIQSVAMSFVQKVIPTLAEKKTFEIETQTMGLIGRMLLFPTSVEIEFLTDAIHDTNLGTDHQETFINIPRTYKELVRTGSLSIKQNQRNAIPHELKSISIENLLFYNAATRFGLDFRADDFQSPGETIPIGIIAGSDSAKYDVEVYNTAHGYKCLHIPISPMTDSISLFFGQEYTWLEIESFFLSVNPDTVFNNNQKIEFPKSHIIMEKMAERAQGLYEILSPSAFALCVTKNLTIEKVNTILSVTYRPIRKSDEMS
jgi:predicted HAD superfamily hydrolase